jgi:hypothetical protein
LTSQWTFLEKSFFERGIVRDVCYLEHLRGFDIPLTDLFNRNRPLLREPQGAGEHARSRRNSKLQSQRRMEGRTGHSETSRYRLSLKIASFEENLFEQIEPLSSNDASINGNDTFGLKTLQHHRHPLSGRSNHGCNLVMRDLMVVIERSNIA